MSLHASKNSWQVHLRVPGQGSRLYLGLFPNETDAAICWNTHVAYYNLNKPLNEVRAEDYIHD